MHTRHPLTGHLRLSAYVLGACLLMPTAFAASSNEKTEIDLQYQLDAQQCNTGQTSQDQTTCLKEAGAAHAEADRNRLNTANESFSQNQTERCNSLPENEREDCLLQMSGHNTATQTTTTQGSVAGGGVLRETTITMPADPSAPPVPSTSPVTPSSNMPAIPEPGENLSPMQGNQQ